MVFTLFVQYCVCLARLVPDRDPGGGGGADKEHEERGCDRGHSGHSAQRNRQATHRWVLVYIVAMFMFHQLAYLIFNNILGNNTEII